MSTHTVLIGYGLTGRSAVQGLASEQLESGVVVVDPDASRTALARRDGARTVLGDGCELLTLRMAGVGEAARIIIAVPDDAVAVRITSQVRGLNPMATICTALRAAGWRSIALYLGADQVVLSAEFVGRVLGLSVRRPGILARLDDVLHHEPELVVAERAVRASEIGKLPVHCGPLVLAIVRDGNRQWRDTAEAAPLAFGDRVLALGLSWTAPSADL